METSIPFSGFYESDHNYLIEQAIEYIFETDKDCGGSPAVPDIIYYTDKMDNKAIEIDYCKLYVMAFAEKFEDITGIVLPVSFKDMTSPREYNFTTDRIFSDISLETVQALYDESAKDDHESLKSKIRERFTSYDGFISSYDNDLSGDDWNKPLEQWDHNQIETLILAVLHIHGGHADDLSAYDLMESCVCNGEIDSIVQSHCSPDLFLFADFQAEQGKALDFEAWE